jgi:hypothetical protein
MFSLEKPRTMLVPLNSVAVLSSSKVLSWEPSLPAVAIVDVDDSGFNLGDDDAT